jgi:hypothetical protein
MPHPPLLTQKERRDPAETPYLEVMRRNLIRNVGYIKPILDISYHLYTWIQRRHSAHKNQRRLDNVVLLSLFMGCGFAPRSKRKRFEGEG